MPGLIIYLHCILQVRQQQQLVLCLLHILSSPTTSFCGSPSLKMDGQPPTANSVWASQSCEYMTQYGEQQQQQQRDRASSQRLSETSFSSLLNTSLVQLRHQAVCSSCCQQHQGYHHYSYSDYVHGLPLSSCQ